MNQMEIFKNPEFGSIRVIEDQKEARHEPDGNFQEPGVWQHPCH